VVDCPPSRGKLTDNALYATENIIIPLRPESGYDSGLTNTADLVQEAREYFDLKILAITPTDLDARIDTNTRDRRLLRELTTRDALTDKVPNFAYLSEDDWQAIDNGGYTGPLPGIRHRAAIDRSIDAGRPLREYAPDCDQLEYYGELARIVEHGEVTRNGI
jgi:chromosome partitioning protein